MKQTNSFYLEEDPQSVPMEKQDSPIPKEKKKNISFRPFFKPMLSILIALGIVVLVVTIGIQYVLHRYIEPVDPQNKVMQEITIERGSSVNKISKLLEEKGIIRNATVFKFYVDFSDMSSKLLAGTYELSPSMTLDDIINTLKRPTKLSDTTRITFVEGTSIDDMGDILVKAGLINNAVDFKKEIAKYTDYQDYWFVKELLEGDIKTRKYVLEGYLMPDTYEFYSDASCKDVIKKLFDQFDKVYTDAFEQRAKELGMTTDQVITLASIIEKEAKRDDFAKVSAVFHNRLKADMKLESCATVQYFMNERRLVWSNDELAIDSPYNTYLYSGLPAGPICNPSLAAIEAALYPDEAYLKENYRFFCLGNPETGELFFAKTYEEHMANVKKYRELWQKHDQNL